MKHQVHGLNERREKENQWNQIQGALYPRDFPTAVMHTLLWCHWGDTSRLCQVKRYQQFSFFPGAGTSNIRPGTHILMHTYVHTTILHVSLKVIKSIHIAEMENTCIGTTFQPWKSLSGTKVQNMHESLMKIFVVKTSYYCNSFVPMLHECSLSLLMTCHYNIIIYYMAVTLITRFRMNM